MALKGKAKRTIQDGVDSLVDFKQGNVSGRYYMDGRDVPNGCLPMTTYERLIHKYRGLSVYVVFSYDTPIAWAHETDNGPTWTVPPFHYSTTTANHQNVVAVAIDNPGFYTDTKW